jgi:hypothetical protein
VSFNGYFEMRDSNVRREKEVVDDPVNAVGHLKMKEAMWRVDPLGDFKFSDSTDPTQQVLFSSPSVAPLVSDLESKFRGGPYKY